MREAFPSLPFGSPNSDKDVPYHHSITEYNNSKDAISKEDENSTTATTTTKSPPQHVRQQQRKDNFALGLEHHQPSTHTLITSKSSTIIKDEGTIHCDGSGPCPTTSADNIDGKCIFKNNTYMPIRKSHITHTRTHIHTPTSTLYTIHHAITICYANTIHMSLFKYRFDRTSYFSSVKWFVLFFAHCFSSSYWRRCCRYILTDFTNCVARITSELHIYVPCSKGIICSSTNLVVIFMIPVFLHSSLSLSLCNSHTLSLNISHPFSLFHSNTHLMWKCFDEI